MHLAIRQYASLNHAAFMYATTPAIYAMLEGVTWFDQVPLNCSKLNGHHASWIRSVSTAIYFITHWLFSDVVIWKVPSWNTCYEWISWALLVTLLPGKYQRMQLMVSQHWFSVSEHTWILLIKMSPESTGIDDRYKSFWLILLLLRLHEAIVIWLVH